MDKLELNGIIPAIVTPFTDDGELDENSLREHINYLLSQGIHGILVNGSTGEAENLSREERKRIIQITVEEVGGRVPVIAGTGVPSTRTTIELTEDAKKMGADAVMIVTPFYLIPNEDGLLRHYKLIAENVDIPFVLYSIPQHTKVNLTPSLVRKLCEEVPNVMALKDSSGNISQFAETLMMVGDRISVLTGSDDLLFPSFMLGARGAIIALGNIAPRLCIELFNSIKTGDISRAKEIYFKLLPISKAIGSEYNYPSLIKEALKLLGRPAGPTRSPIVSASKEEIEAVKQALRFAGLI